MTYVLLGMALLAILHFVYEGILLPSIRLELRYRLFSERDELRALKSKENSEISDEVFAIGDASINNAISLLPRLSIGAMYTWTQQLRDEQLKTQIEKRLKILDACSNQDFQRIRHESGHVLTYAFLANGGACFFYIVPIAFGWVCLKKLGKMILSLLVLSQAEVNRLLPAEAPAAALA